MGGDTVVIDVHLWVEKEGVIDVYFGLRHRLEIYPFVGNDTPFMGGDTGVIIVHLWAETGVVDVHLRAEK